MAWTWLAIAACMEILGAVGLKRAPIDGGWWWPITIVAMVGSVGCLTLAIRTMPLGPSYAIWTGAGMLGTTAVGMIWLGEPVSAMRLVFMGLILSGIVGLRIS